MPRTSASGLLTVASQYIHDNTAIAFAKRYPFFERIRNGHGAKSLEINGTNIKRRLGSTVGTNPWNFKSGGFSTTPNTYYNSIPRYAQWTISRLEAAWAVDVDQQRLFDRVNDDRKGAIVEMIGDEMLQYLMTRLATVMGTAQDQSETSMGGLPFFGDTTNSPGGIAAATGHAAAVDATLVISIQNLRAKKRFMEQERAATPTFWLVSTASGGNDLEGKLANYATSATVVQASDKKPNYGHLDYTVLGLPVYTLQTLPASELYLMQDDTLAAILPDSPEKTDMYTVPATSVEGQTLYLYNALVPANIRTMYRAALAS